MVKDLNARGPGAPVRAGEDVSIPFQPTDERSKEVEVDVDTGDSFTSERITVRAGEQSSHVIKLKPAQVKARSRRLPPRVNVTTN